MYKKTRRIVSILGCIVLVSGNFCSKAMMNAKKVNSFSKADDPSLEQAKALLKDIVLEFNKICPKNDYSIMKNAFWDVLKLSDDARDVSAIKYSILANNNVNNNKNNFCCWDLALALDYLIHVIAKCNGSNIESTVAGYKIVNGAASHHYNIFVYNGYIFVIDVLSNYCACAPFTDTDSVDNMFYELCAFQSGASILGDNNIWSRIQNFGDKFYGVQSQIKNWVTSKFGSNLYPKDEILTSSPDNVYVRENIWAPNPEYKKINELNWVPLKEFRNGLKSQDYGENGIINGTIERCTQRQKGIGFFKAGLFDKK